MSALTQERGLREERWRYKQFTLTSGHKGYKGASAYLVLGTGKVVQGAAAVGMVYIGVFAETVDATSGDQLINVDLLEEIDIVWFANGTSTDAVASTDMGGVCYVADDQTVGILPTGRSEAGRVWAVDSVFGVAVQKVAPARSGKVVTLAAFTSNDTAPTAIVHDGVYAVPATGAASTVSLPVATGVPDGTRAYFVADGTNNANTVQYRDVTTAITTALTASKRHLVIVIAQGGKWFANAYVSP